MPIAVVNADTRLIVEKTPQLARTARVLELPECLAFDLPYALAGDRKLLTDFLQSGTGVHVDAEAHAQHPFLARRQADSKTVNT